MVVRQFRPILITSQRRNESSYFKVGMHLYYHLTTVIREIIFTRIHMIVDRPTQKNALSLHINHLHLQEFILPYTHTAIPSSHIER